jgi:Cellulase (glycosyl hydrolase family 5)
MGSAAMRVVFRFVLPVALALAGPATAAQLTASVDERSGLPMASIGGASVLSSAFVFWRKNWAWAGLSSKFSVLAPFEYDVTGASRDLELDLSGQIRRPTERQLVWDFDFNARKSTPEAIGGGISFGLNLAALGSQLGEPELLPENRGWSWGKPGGTRMEMRFDPPLAAVYFERGQKNQIRAFFYKGEVPQGRLHHTATLTVSNDIAIGPTTAERFGLDDPASWPTDILDWRTSPVDLSFLNASEKPAGKRGFLRAVKDKLVFEDGTPARFWGTNLTAGALFGTMLREDVQVQARRLSQLGFNLVRIHHHDSSWVNPNVFGKGKPANTQNISEESLATLDWWIKCLQDEGIYVWLDLHVGREVTAADGIAGFEEITKGKRTAQLKGFNYVNASIQKAMQRFNAQYVNHLNAFTGKRYKDDPAIIAMLITNEDDLTSHFGNTLLPDKKVPIHNAAYMAQAADFAAGNHLSKDKTWRAWEHGPSKLFLNDLEHRFDANMIAQLRALGVKAPIVTTSTWGNNPLSSLPALTTGDIIDVHAYGATGELERSPLGAPNLMHWLAAGQVAGRPMTATEWNVSPFPAPDRHSAPLLVGASAALQGWDGLMQYAYSQGRLVNAGSPSNWESFNDPGLIATLPAAALLYRRGDVREAGTTYVFAPTPEQLYGRQISPANSVALRTAAEKGKLVIAMPETRELPWLQKSEIPIGAVVITDPDQSLIDANAGGVVAAGGEIAHNWADGLYTINTSRTQAATGWIGGKEIALHDVTIAAATRNASVAVQSLDGNPISEARSLMISLGARSEPSPGNKMPFHSEPVTGQLTIRAPKGLKLYARAGGKERAVAAPFADGRYTIALGRELGTYWLVLR